MTKEEFPEKEKSDILSEGWEGPIKEKDYSKGSIPPKEWPYGPPSYHQKSCALFEGKSFCDCEASDESNNES